MSHIDDRLSAYVDGELGQDGRLLVETHLVQCAECRAELDSISFVRNAMRDLEWLPVPEALRPSPAPRRTAPGWRRRLVPLVAAATAVTVFAGIGGARGSDPIEIERAVDQHLARVSLDPGPNMVQVRTVVGP